MKLGRKKSIGGQFSERETASSIKMPLGNEINGGGETSITEGRLLVTLKKKYPRATSFCCSFFCCYWWWGDCYSYSI